MHAVLPLADLATRINAEHHQVERNLRSAISHGLDCGDLLLQARDQCAHGEWLPWLNANFEGSQKRAWEYMELAKCRETIEAKLAQCANLSMRAALRLARPEPEPKPIPIAANPASESEQVGEADPAELIACINKRDERKPKNELSLEEHQERCPVKLRPLRDKLLREIAWAVNHFARKRFKEENASYIEALERREKEAADKKKMYMNMMKPYTAIISEHEYRKVLGCLHPDRATNEAEEKRLNEAFEIFKRLKSKVK